MKYLPTDYRFTDATGKVFEIIKRPEGHGLQHDYALYVDGEFWCNSDTYDSAKDAVNDLFEEEK